MNHRIQIMVDEQLNKAIKTGAKKMGLSISSYARLALMNGLSQKKSNLLLQAMEDLYNNDTESLSFDEFKDQLNK